MNSEQYIGSCWCASSIAVTQTATHCHLHGSLAMSLDNTKWKQDIWYYFLICPSCKSLSESECLLALKQEWLYVNYCVFACSKYIRWVVNQYILTKQNNLREVHEIIKMLISFLVEIKWHGNGEKNKIQCTCAYVYNGMQSHCIL